MSKIMSIDCETDGLWGLPFAIGAIVYENGIETARFLARLPNSFVSNEWVKQNILPALEGVSITDTYLDSLLFNFSKFYKAHKGATHICHMGYICEARLFLHLQKGGFIGDFEAPYPLLDISGHLQMVCENPLSVDEYAKKYNLEIQNFGATHNPLHDCEVAAKVYMDIIKKSGIESERVLVINGHENKNFNKNEISYYEIGFLAKKRGLLTITYNNALGEGLVAPNEKVKIVGKTVINCLNT